MKFLEKYEDFIDFDSNAAMRQLKVYMDIANRNRLSGKSYNKISDEFEYYFADMTDDGWKIYYHGDDYQKSLDLWKNIKVENAESEFNNIVDRMSEIRGRLSDEGFRSMFLIDFGGKGQQNHNPVTHQNDDYKFKGVGHRVEPDGTFRAKITYVII